jgi:hypothetical protein
VGVDGASGSVEWVWWSKWVDGIHACFVCDERVPVKHSLERGAHLSSNAIGRNHRDDVGRSMALHAF